MALKFIYIRSLRFSATDFTHRVPFYMIFSAIFLLILHGSSFFKILAILSVNYVLGKASSNTKLGPVLTWAFNGGILFANEWNSGYRFSTLHPSLAILVNLLDMALGVSY
jgi:protein-cysteine N-palmitoyltransferase HHAT